MRKTKRLSLATSAACVLLLAALAGCATPTQRDVGAVVIAPKVQIPPAPAIVQQTPPKEPGYFQNRLLNYFSSLSEKPMK